MQNKESVKKSPDLLSCPFCGGEAKLRKGFDFDDDVYYWVECKKCFLKSFNSPNSKMAVEKWNTRKPVDAVLARLEEIKNTPPELQYRALTLQDAIDIVKEGIT